MITLRMNPTMPAEAQLNGEFDYNRTPLCCRELTLLYMSRLDPEELEIFRELRYGTLGEIQDTTDVGLYMSQRRQQFV